MSHSKRTQGPRITTGPHSHDKSLVHRLSPRTLRCGPERTYVLVYPALDAQRSIPDGEARSMLLDWYGVEAGHAIYTGLQEGQEVAIAPFHHIAPVAA